MTYLAADDRIERLERAVYWAENLMRAIIENEPDDIIADGGITVWHGIEHDARRWLDVHALVLPANSDNNIASDLSNEPGG